MKNTRIEWCDSTLNLAMGCDGCELWNPRAGVRHCYAGVMTEHWGGRPGWPASFDRPELFLFTEALPIDWLVPLLPRLENSPHQWFTLTKRPHCLLEFSRRHPLPPSVWAGVSITSQQDERVRQLLQVEAAIRFLSCEPLLAPLDLSEYLATGGIHGVVVGGESGARARRMESEWALAVRDQCQVAGVPFFFKQWGQQQEGRKLDGREWSEMPIAARSLAAGVQASLWDNL